jgi:hypothetical protein
LGGSSSKRLHGVGNKLHSYVQSGALWLASCVSQQPLHLLQQALVLLARLHPQHSRRVVGD